MLRVIFVVAALMGMTTMMPPVQAQETQRLETVVLDVPGMTCKFCPITIRKALQKLPGVVEVKSDLDSKTATVVFDPAQTNVEALTRATADAGYPSSPRKPQ